MSSQRTNPIGEQPGNWSRIRALFAEAIEIDPAIRTSWLREKCRHNPVLGREVASLLEHDDLSDQFLESPAWGLNDQSGINPEDDRARPGDRIGSWNVLREIGSGGMGRLYLAERIIGDEAQSVRQLAAIKVIRARMDVQLFTRRFRRECRILAQLNHPFIARFLEGGTLENGLPYLVLDYVQGEPIGDYCRNRGLGLRETLQLFCQVCSAVAYAHRNLVVHRDLKPSNILIDPDETPRLLDFGIAKLLTDDEESIDQTQGLGPCTPRYASPEQIRGGSITTASDIFVLGIILYELLTGAHPFDTARDGEAFPMIDVLRRICEEEPIKLREHPEKTRRDGHARQSVGRDLQSIILKALQKAPVDRYKSVEYLIDDVQNFVNRRPVLARRQSWWYRTRTLLRRHPTAALASSAAVVVAIIAVGFILASDRTAREERDYALQQRELAASSARTMINDLASSLESMSAPIERRLELLNQVAAVFDQIDATSRTDVDPALNSVQLRAEVQTQLILARALEELGDMQGAIHRVEAGELRAKKMLSREISDPIDQLFLQEALLEKCRVFSRSGNVVAADELLAKALTKLREIENVHGLAENPRKVEILLCNALVLEERLSDPFAKPNETVQLLKEAIQYGESAYQKASFDREALDCYARSLEELAGFYYAWGRFDLFTGPIRKALGLRRRAAEEAPTDMFLRQHSERAVAHWESLLALADPQEQESNALGESLSIQRKLCAADPNNLDLLEDLIGVLDNDAIILGGRKEYDEAKRLLLEAVEIGKKLKQEKKRTFNVNHHLYRIAFTLSHCSRMTGDLEAARKINLELLTPLREELDAVDPSKCDNRFRKVLCCCAQADVAGAAGNWREAHQMYLKSLSDLEENFRRRDYPYDQYAYGYCLARLGRAEAELGKTGAGCQRIEHALGILYGLRDSGRIIPRSFISDDITEAEEALRQFQKEQRNADPSVDLGTK